MLKPSYKSIEGQSIYAVIGGGLVLLYEILAGSAGDVIPVEELLQHAQTAKDIAAAYHADVTTVEGWGTAKVIAILTFIYKIYSRFTDSRTELKKKEMEVKKDV